MLKVLKAVNNIPDTLSTERIPKVQASFQSLNSRSALDFFKISKTLKTLMTHFTELLS